MTTAAKQSNEDLACEYQAIIGYVVYSQLLSGAQYMDIAAQLEIHTKQELDHALIISQQIDYFGTMPAVTPAESNAVVRPGLLKNPIARGVR
jgi:bacterioferritin